jgi:hypothetical protein
MTMPTPSERWRNGEPITPLPGELQMTPEQRARLDRVRRIYHDGTQSLTVARARYDLIRRGAFDGPGTH